MNRTVQVVLVAVLIVAFGTLGFTSYRWYSRESATTPIIAVPLETSAPQQPSARTLPEVRPEFSLKDREGRLRSINEWDGKSLVLNFWATWCAPCRREIPMLKELRARRAAQGVEVIGVAVDVRADVLKYADRIGIDYPILIGEQDAIDAAAKFGIATIAFPFTVFTDKRGRIVTAHLGELHKDEADAIIDQVVAVNEGKASLPEAQRKIADAFEKIPPHEESHEHQE